MNIVGQTVFILFWDYYSWKSCSIHGSTKNHLGMSLRLLIEGWKSPGQGVGKVPPSKGIVFWSILVIVYRFWPFWLGTGHGLRLSVFFRRREHLVYYIIHWFHSQSLSVGTTSDFILTPPSSWCNPDPIISKGYGFNMASLNITTILKHLQ